MISKQERNKILRDLPKTNYGTALNSFIDEITANLIKEAIYEADSMEKIYGIRYMLKLLRQMRVILNLPSVEEKKFQQYE